MDAPSGTSLGIALPPSLTARGEGEIAILSLARPEKRNALDDETILGLETFFELLPDKVKAVVVHGEGDHFSAGLDLGELVERDIIDGVAHSRMWHRVFDRIQFGRVPVVAVLHGAVIGGGLELAAAAHLRIAERSAFYALPEGQRGIFVGGGGAVRLPRLIGVARMTDMMLTGRAYNAEDGQIIGLSHYLVEPGEGLNTGIELAQKIAGNAPLTNFAVMHVLPRIAECDPASGFLTESLMAAIAQDDEEAKARLKAFLEKRAPKAAGRT